jgi:hypothetical protein
VLRLEEGVLEDTDFVEAEYLNGSTEDCAEELSVEVGRPRMTAEELRIAVLFAVAAKVRLWVTAAAAVAETPRLLGPILVEPADTLERSRREM